MTDPDVSTDAGGALASAASAARAFGALRPGERAVMLRAVAGALDGAAGELVPLAERESHLPEARLRGELVRTTFQLRLFADVLDDGSYLRATIDHFDQQWTPGARPDLRRILLPVGPVVVFAASNFPFAFSVAGGDTASALAAGAPVVLKAHPGHPELSRRTAAIVSGALRQAGAPDGAFSLIEGERAGRDAVLDVRTKAAAFTGSATAGRALFDLACSRAVPIPFYAEMGSLNPVFVTRGAASERGEAIWSGFTDSFTLGTGQFCTKPGLLFVPSSSGARERVTELVSGRGTAPLLNQRIAAGYRETRATLSEHPAVRTLVAGEDAEAGPSPTLLATTVPELLAHRDVLLDECFGPTSIVVDYDDEEQLLDAARAFDGELTAGIHASAGEEVAAALLAELTERAGRVLFDGWPTGVAVSHAMQHGGPYPATTAPLHTSVGTAAIERFLRPVCFQDAPPELLPEALREDNPLAIPRRVDGVG